MVSRSATSRNRSVQHAGYMVHEPAHGSVSMVELAENFSPNEWLVAMTTPSWWANLALDDGWIVPNEYSAPPTRAFTSKAGRSPSLPTMHSAAHFTANFGPSAGKNPRSDTAAANGSAAAVPSGSGWSFTLTTNSPPFGTAARLTFVSGDSEEPTCEPSGLLYRNTSSWWVCGSKLSSMCRSQTSVDWNRSCALPVYRRNELPVETESLKKFGL
jgi:hypothetical protein